MRSLYVERNFGLPFAEQTHELDLAFFLLALGGEYLGACVPFAKTRFTKSEARASITATRQLQAKPGAARRRITATRLADLLVTLADCPKAGSVGEPGDARLQPSSGIQISIVPRPFAGSKS